MPTTALPSAEIYESILPQATNYKPKPKLHLTHLDGLRGLAALYVVTNHVYAQCVRGDLTSGLGVWTSFVKNALQLGHLSVSIFIVLSGYCLMLPVGRAGYQFKFKTFVARRAKRILPPYYAALLLTLFLTAALPELRRPTHGIWDDVQPALTFLPIASHFLLIQDLSPAWVFKISYPMWSVALEWQIYFVFALAMLPLWRRFGIVSVLIATLLGGTVLDRFHVAASCSHYIFLFALGMLGALISHSSRPADFKRWRQLPWSMIGLFAIAIFVLLSHGTAYWLARHATQGDILIGIATLCLLVQCDKWINEYGDNHHSMFLRLLQSRICVGLGLFSYSLYLIHAPIIAIVGIFVNQMHLQLGSEIAIEMAIAVPFSVATAYVFHCMFEKPFLNSKLRVQSASNMNSDARASAFIK